MKCFGRILKGRGRTSDFVLGVAHRCTQVVPERIPVGNIWTESENLSSERFDFCGITEHAEVMVDRFILAYRFRPRARKTLQEPATTPIAPGLKIIFHLMEV